VVVALLKHGASRRAIGHHQGRPMTCYDAALCSGHRGTANILAYDPMSTSIHDACTNGQVIYTTDRIYVLLS